MLPMILGTVVPEIFKIIDNAMPDKTAADAAKLKVMELTSKENMAKIVADSGIDIAQINVNQEEAKSQDKFVSRVRSAAEWLGVVILGSSWGLEIVSNVAVFFGYPNPHLQFLGAASVSTASQLLFGLLGIRVVPYVANKIAQAVLPKPFNK